jgi:hypothetical protein
MTTERLSIEQWRREAPALRAKGEKVLERFIPARRQKPRHPAEADFLRRIGTPEHLIGPTTTDPE